MMPVRRMRNGRCNRCRKPFLPEAFDLHLSGALCAETTEMPRGGPASVGNPPVPAHLIPAPAMTEPNGAAPLKLKEDGLAAVLAAAVVAAFIAWVVGA